MVRSSSIEKTRAVGQPNTAEIVAKSGQMSGHNGSFHPRPSNPRPSSTERPRVQGSRQRSATERMTGSGVAEARAARVVLALGGVEATRNHLRSHAMVRPCD